MKTVSFTTCSWPELDSKNLDNDGFEGQLSL